MGGVESNNIPNPISWHKAALFHTNLHESVCAENTAAIRVHSLNQDNHTNTGCKTFLLLLFL